MLSFLNLLVITTTLGDVSLHDAELFGTSLLDGKIDRLPLAVALKAQIMVDHELALLLR